LQNRLVIDQCKFDRRFVSLRQQLNGHRRVISMIAFTYDRLSGSRTPRPSEIFEQADVRTVDSAKPQNGPRLARHIFAFAQNFSGRVSGSAALSSVTIRHWFARKTLVLLVKSIRELRNRLRRLLAPLKYNTAVMIESPPRVAGTMNYYIEIF